MAKFNLKEKLKLAEKLIQNDNYFAAGELLREVISLYPKNLEANYKLGAISIALNKLDDALYFFKQINPYRRKTSTGMV